MVSKQVLESEVRIIPAKFFVGRLARCVRSKTEAGVDYIDEICFVDR